MKLNYFLLIVQLLLPLHEEWYPGIDQLTMKWPRAISSTWTEAADLAAALTTHGTGAPAIGLEAETVPPSINASALIQSSGLETTMASLPSLPWRHLWRHRTALQTQCSATSTPVGLAVLAREWSWTTSSSLCRLVKNYISEKRRTATPCAAKHTRQAYVFLDLHRSVY